MLRVTIEMLPHGLEEHKRTIGQIEIVNQGTGTETRGNYEVRVARKGSPKRTWKRGFVKDFPRGTKGPYDLLLQALGATVGARNTRVWQILEGLLKKDPTMPVI